MRNRAIVSILLGGALSFVVLISTWVGGLKNEAEAGSAATSTTARPVVTTRKPGAEDESFSSERETADHWETDENGGWHYVLADGSLYSGWLSVEDGCWYFDEAGDRYFGWLTTEEGTFWLPEGVMLTGLHRAGKNTYFFDESGCKKQGWIVADGKNCYILPDDTLAVGEMVIDGETCFFEADGSYKNGWIEGAYYDHGHVMTGLVQIGDSFYLLDEQGHFQSGLVTWQERLYLFAEDGHAEAGFVEHQDQTYYVEEDGRVQTGFVFLNGVVYYFHEDGSLARNTTIQGIDVDENGVCSDCFDTITPENLDAYIGYLLHVHGSSLWEIFAYVKNNFSFKFAYKTDVTTMAIRILNQGYGACWDYDALMQLMLKKAGYESVFVIGKTPNNSMGEHDWLLVEVEPGVWRHMDPQRQGIDVFMMTDAQLLKLHGVYGNYDWDPSLYPFAGGADITVPRPATTTTPTRTASTTAAETTAAETEPAETEPETTAPETEPTTEEPETTLPETEPEPEKEPEGTVTESIPTFAEPENTEALQNTAAAAQ